MAVVERLDGRQRVCHDVGLRKSRITVCHGDHGAGVAGAHVQGGGVGHSDRPRHIGELGIRHLHPGHVALRAWRHDAAALAEAVLAVVARLVAIACVTVAVVRHSRVRRAVAVPRQSRMRVGELVRHVGVHEKLLVARDFLEDAAHHPLVMLHIRTQHRLDPRTVAIPKRVDCVHTMSNNYCGASDGPSRRD